MPNYGEPWWRRATTADGGPLPGFGLLGTI
jgi:hypothetical protein